MLAHYTNPSAALLLLLLQVSGHQAQYLVYHICLLLLLRFIPVSQHYPRAHALLPVSPEVLSE